MKKLKRDTDSVIVHFDCFYASVFEHENPALRSLPLAVQQKQIVVTCNYEARRRGLHKLQLIHQAKKVCSDVVIVLGEDLTRFRNASKLLYTFLRSFSWNERVERLGLDEVFLDITDIIDYNISILNPNNLTNAFFCLAKEDPTRGFPYNATALTGHLYPKTASCDLGATSPHRLHLRLALGSHFAHYLRTKLQEEKGYTASVGVSTNKLLAKLVGNTYKPNAQTTLVPPYTSDGNDESESLDNVTTFIDDHEVGKIPGIGFKIAQKLRAYVLQRPADFDAGLVYGGTKETVLVHDVRMFPGMGPETLERILSGPGVPHGTGIRVWGLLNGCDDAQVGLAREIPRQISIEDSYMRLDSLDQVTKELKMLARRLLERMHTDLLEEDDDANDQNPDSSTRKPVKRWLAHPKTLRLSTRPRPPQNPNGNGNRSFARISRSAPMPTFVFNLNPATTTDTVVEKLVHETLLPLFRKLHPEKRGWNLSLVNVAATNVADAASEKGGIGRDISKMFKRQDAVLRQWRVEEEAAGFEQRLLTIQEPKQNQAEQEGLVMKEHASFEQRDVTMDESDGNSMEEDWIIEEPEIQTREEEKEEDNDEWLTEAELGHSEPRVLMMQALNQSQQVEPYHSDQQVLMMQSPCSTPSSEQEEEQRPSQEPWLQEWKRELAQDNAVVQKHGSEDFPTPSQDVESTVADVWEDEDEDMVDGDGDGDTFRCEECGAVMPMFALGAHWRWHESM